MEKLAFVCFPLIKPLEPVIFGLKIAWILPTDQNIGFLEGRVNTTYSHCCEYDTPGSENLKALYSHHVKPVDNSQQKLL